MHAFRKLWLYLAAGVLAVLAMLLLILSRDQSIKATSSPPPGSHLAGDVWVADLGGRTAMEMVWCPPGKFLMGSPASEPDRQFWEPNEIRHEVTLTQGFWIGKYEVTQAQWVAIMGTNPAYFPAKMVLRWKTWEWQIPVWHRDFLTSRWQLPMEEVSWNDCQKFCRKAGGGCRLPTEAEWEYACRAGSAGMYAGSGVLNEMGWFDDNSDEKTHPVGWKKPNAWGLYDMHGNVWEWCQDWYGGDYPAGAATDPSGPAAGVLHAIRGGSWCSPSESCRSACRLAFLPDIRDNGEGFRVIFPAVRP